jgi:hypothetical protein
VNEGRLQSGVNSVLANGCSCIAVSCNLFNDCCRIAPVTRCEQLQQITTSLGLASEMHCVSSKLTIG